AYLDLAQPEEDYDEAAAQFLQRAINALSAPDIWPSLYGGFTGIAWAVEHLKGRLIDQEDEGTNEEIDEALKEYVGHSPWNDDYDLINGLVGFGVYALERQSASASVVSCLERIVERLKETAEYNADGVTWLTRPYLLSGWQREQCPDGNYNLGLAHGVPGVVALLSRVCAAGVAVKQARSLLDGAVVWLLRQRQGDSAVSSFSHLAAPDIEEDDCRLAWCYGDAGVAAALLVAARCVNEENWEREALAIARRAAAREPESAGVKDAGLCHGAAGLGHVFNRLFQATGEEVFREAACYWFERTLAMTRTSQGIAGYSVFMPDEDGRDRWVDEPGILMGAAGIALALLAAATDIEPQWDRMLLVSSFRQEEKKG
ncbi:MAG TPA: lanthionine synthetase C family protein, partial [Blastocatellia bacterium]|nr:lanthionine synthetase C family protein [Blastocatellia bacterium]